MKKTTWKKIMSLVLVAALVIGCLQLNAKKVSADSAATVSEVGVVTNTTDPSNPTVTYDLTASNGSSSVFQGTYTDIVLAIDLSNSMKAENGKNPLQDAKDAAKAFVAKLLGAEAATKDYVKIAVVTYGTKATTVCPLTNDVAELNKKINGISINSNNGGTNYDDGIDEAQSALAGSQNEKVLVFMSDGEPTYANGSYEYLGYSRSFNNRPNAVKSLTADDHIKRTSSMDDYFVKNGVLYLWDSQGYWYKANLSDSSNNVVGLGNESCSVIADAATAEAAEAKNAGFTIYTILFNSSSTTATTVLDAIATSGKASTTTDALSKVYDEIGDTITNTIIAGSNAYILAELSDYVKYNPPVEGIDGITTETKDGKTYLTWTIGESLAGDHTSPAIPFAVDKQKVIDAYKANPNAFKVENGKIVVPVTTTATLVYSKGQEEIKNPVTTSATVQLDVNDFIDYTINYIADGQTVKADNGTVYTGTKITPVKYTMTELGLTDGYYDDYTVSETEINANNKVINININHKVATVSFYEISDNGFDAEGKDDVTKFIVSKEVKFGDQITADITENGDKVAIVARNYSKEVTPEVASEAAITYTWTWTGKWDGLGVAEADEISVLALYNDSNAAGNLYTVTFKNGDSTVYTVKQRPGTTFNAPAATEKAPDKQYTYTFANWKLVDGEETLEAGAQKVEVTGDKTYVADYTTEDVLYNVRFVNDADADLINAFTVKYEEVIAADKLKAAKDAAEAYAKSKTDAEDNKTTEYTFTDWDNDETAAVVDDITFKAQFTESKKQYTVTYKYYDGQQAEISKQTVNAGEDVTFIPAPEVANKKFVSFGYENENGEYVAYGQNGIKNILENKVVFLTYRDILKGEFNFYKFEETVTPNECDTVAFDEDTEKASIVAPAGLEKADTATVDYTFKEWVTFITYADMLERTKEKVVVSDDVDREVQFSAVNAPNAAAGTKTEDGEWITFAEYMEEYFAIEDRDFFPTYDAKDITPITNTPITNIPNILPPVVTETPEEPTPTPTAEPTPEPTAEPTPVEEEPIVVEEPETPEGDVVEDLEPVDTPQSAPEEEELDVEPIDTPQGDLPKTGVAPSAVFFGIGAACVVFGGAIVIKLRRKEEM